MYILYGGDFTRSGLVQWVLDEGGLDYALRKIDIINGENKAPAFLAINPSGLVPVLITPEGEALTENRGVDGHACRSAPPHGACARCNRSAARR